MKKLIPLILICALMVAAFTLPAWAEENGAKNNDFFIGVWSADLQGSVKSGTTAADLKDDLLDAYDKACFSNTY